MARLFVYGTLKTGQPNHTMLDDNSFITRARTVERFPLVIATENNIPFLLNVPGTGQRVCGEIYSVDERMLEILDEFESCPKMYQRTSIRLEILGQETTPETVEAFVYSTETYESDWLRKETYESYDAHGAHGLKYICREDR